MQLCVHGKGLNARSCSKNNNVTVYAAGARNEPADRITPFNNNVFPLPDKVTLNDVGKLDAHAMCPSYYFKTDEYACL